MNDGVNGTMEEPMESSPPSPPTNACKNITPEDSELKTNHCENSNNTENSNHLNSESSQDPLDTNHVETAENTTKDNDDSKPDQSVTDNSTRKTCSNLENHCSNSNGSCSDSMTSSQAKSETTEPPRFENVDEKSNQKDSEQNDMRPRDVILSSTPKVYKRNPVKLWSPSTCLCQKEQKRNDVKLTSQNQKKAHESDDEVDSEEDSSDEEDDSEDSNEPRDTVSINSDSENSRQSLNKNKNSDVILVDNGRDSQNGNPDEVHEIVSDNDDCVVTSEAKEKAQLRRSSRAVKRKVYEDEIENGDYDDESDIEEVELEDPLNRSAKPIVSKDTKKVVETPAKKLKKNQESTQKKEPTLVIIDTNSIMSEKESSNQSKNFSANVQHYQNVVGRGTTVTAVSSKAKSVSPTPVSAQPSILPSLTDDMFVVEAPSFIVPYVYEKPSVKPFREFVDVLGKELEEQRAKEEQEMLEKEKLEKEKKEQEKKERIEKGEHVEDSEEETEAAKEEVEEDEEEERKKKKAEKKERRRRRNEDDDVSWDGESSSSSEDDILSDEEKTVVIKDKADSIEEIKDVTELSTEKVAVGKQDNYFDCSLGKFFINIGVNLVQEYVQQDLLKQQNRKLYREKKSGQKTKATESSIASLMKNLEFSKNNNAPYTFPQKKCEFCSFKSESKLAMAHHLETPHMKNNVYKCNFCAFEIRSPHDILYHMEAEHNVRGKLERAPAYHQCANCPFEDNGKGKLARHLIPCAKKFKPDVNLAPPAEWEPPAKIPKITRARNNIVGSYQNAFTRAQIGNHLNRPAVLSNVLGVPGVPGYRPRGRAPLAVPPRASPVHGAPIVRGGVMVRHSTPVPVLMSSNYPVANNGKNVGAPKAMHQPSISITPLPRGQAPLQTPPQPQNKGTFVICEICDGYIKDLEQLRNHMQWIHKVKIHPKMIYNRPPLNCQKCQFRFFTDQGLERHLLGSHGLVTSSMQEAANKGKDAGRCPVCGRVYQWKLLSHVGRDHNLTLKPAHLSYKCTVCTATFGMYKQFENHVYSAHSVVAKRVMDKTKTSTPKGPNDSLLKPLKINDEITIIPQPAKNASTQHKDK